MYKVSALAEEYKKKLITADDAAAMAAITRQNGSDTAEKQLAIIIDSLAV